MKMQKTSNKLENILDLIKKSQTVLITSHRDPDGDSIGSQLALAEFVESWGKSCRVVNEGDLPYKYMFLDPQGRIESIHAVKGLKDVGAVSDLVLVLDCTSMNRVGKVKKMLPAEALLINIDHHPDNEEFGTLNYVDVDASAVGEVIFSLLTVSGFPISHVVATQLYAAILTDTGRFKFSNTTPSCLRVCAELIELGADPKHVTNQIYFNHSLPFLKLLGSTLSSPEILGEGRICAMTVKQSLMADLRIDPKEVEGVVDYSLFSKGVEIGLLFTEKKNGKTKVNLRSQNEFDVSKVARAFAGGGHRNAAGCILKCSLKQAKKIMVEQIQKTLKDEPVRSFTS